MRILCHPPLDLSSLANHDCFTLSEPLLGEPAIDAIIQSLQQNQLHALIVSTKSCDIAMLMERLKSHFDSDARCALIVTHSDERLAYRAWLLGVDGYLTEPIDYQALVSMLAKIERPTLAYCQHLPSSSAVGTFATEQGLLRLFLDDIYCVLANQKSTILYHKHGTYLIANTLKNLLEQYPDELIRIHRNALVNCRYIQALHSDDGAKLVIADEKTGFCRQLAISRRQLADVRQRLKKL